MTLNTTQEAHSHGRSVLVFSPHRLLPRGANMYVQVSLVRPSQGHARVKRTIHPFPGVRHRRRRDRYTSREMEPFHNLPSITQPPCHRHRTWLKRNSPMPFNASRFGGGIFPCSSSGPRLTPLPGVALAGLLTVFILAARILKRL